MSENILTVLVYVGFALEFDYKFELLTSTT